LNTTKTSYVKEY